MKIVFFGSPEFAVPSLEVVAARHEVALVVTQPDRPAGRGRALQPPPVAARARALGFPVEQPVKIREPGFAERLTALAPDVFVVVAYGRILPPRLLAIPRLGPWNVHASLLPRLRGAAPIQWAIMRDERRTGVCIMRMEEGLDTGPVAARAELEIRDDDTAGTLSERLSHLGADLLARTLPSIANGSVALEPQDDARATLAPILTKEDGLLDFGLPARQVAAHARGVDPWPGATAMLLPDPAATEPEPVKLFRPRVVDGQGAPGEVLGARPEGLAVACVSGAVAFAELQFPGRKRLPAAAVLAGRPIPAGARFTSRAKV